MQGDASNKAKQGFITNVTALPNIQSIEIIFKVKTSVSSSPAYSVYAGSSTLPVENAIAGTSSTIEENGFRVYTETYDLSADNYSFFTIKNDKKGALYIDSIKVTYKSN